MTQKHGISRILDDLHKLYYKLCAIDLRKRMSLYQRNTSTNAAPDISTSLKKHFDKLAPASKPNTSVTANAATSISSRRPGRPVNAKQPRSQPREFIKMATAFIRPKKIFTTIKASDRHMGEKLKDSIWSHTHTATLQARQGNVSNAKLHAEIANDALKEAAHYMSEEDYKALCNEVTEALKALER